MFLLDRMGFIALLGLFTQAGLSWIAVAMFGAMLRAGAPRYLHTWTRAFVALAIGLTLMSLRFFAAFEFDPEHPDLWNDGQPPAVLVYVLYNLAKGVFALLLVRGACEFAGFGWPRHRRAVVAAVMLWLGVMPLLVAKITLLVALQAPVMVAASGMAWWVLRPAGRHSGAGGQLVRFALAGTAMAWVVHGMAAVAGETLGHGFWTYVMAFNSYIDLVLELPLAAGLIVMQLQDAQHELQQAVAEQQRLRTEVERNERLRALGTLVSGVAHELNNPLTAILGYAGDLADASTGTGHPAAQVVREQAERCSGIVRSLSALAGGCAHPAEPVDALELCERVVRGLGPQLESRRVQVQTKFDPSLGTRPNIMADRVGMEQVLTNLLINAVQASPPRSVVTLELRRLGDRIEFAVADLGPGVPVALRERIFEPFFTTKEPGRGTGLGLALAHAIVRENGGELTVEDNDGGGARFCVRLPATECEPATTEPAAAVPLGPLHLLLVDDEPALRAMVRRQAERRGWQVEEVATAEDALSRVTAADAPYDAILCDLRMPGLGGIGLHDELQQQASPWLQRCVFFTGDLASPDAAAFARRCCRPLVLKPFDFPVLFASIDAAAGRGAA